jgi:hypothetical protein
MDEQLVKAARRISQALRDGHTITSVLHPDERSMAMAEKETPKAEEKREPTAAEKRAAEEKAAQKEAERAEAQRVLALRLQYGPIRDPE